eukprot:1180692-Prorocentrum_minimum.AAC.1
MVGLVVTSFPLLIPPIPLIVPLRKLTSRPLGFSSPGLRRKRAARISRLVSAGQFGKARRELLSLGVATSTPEVIQQLRDKHRPARKRPIDWNHIFISHRTLERQLAAS